MRRLIPFMAFAYTLTLFGTNLAQAQGRAPITYFVLIDSTVVAGRPVRQDSAMTVVAKRNGELTYLESYQIVRKSYTKPPQLQQGQNGAPLFAFVLRDGATVYGRVVRRTPVAVVVRQPNGTQTYIDPGDVLSTTPVADSGENRRTQTGSRDDEPAASPYLLSSRPAYTPRAGQVYYRNTYLVRNELEVGLTNGWSLGVAFNPRFDEFYSRNRYVGDAVYANADFGTQIYSRIGVPIGQKIRLGASLLAQFRRQSGDQVGAPDMLVQALASFGDRRSNITLGYTFGLARLTGSSQAEGTLTVGARQDLSPSLSVISDNTIQIRSVSGSLARLGAALRIHRNWHAFDLGVQTTVTPPLYYYSPYSSYYPLPYTYISTRFRAYPYVSYAVQIGRRS